MADLRNALATRSPSGGAVLQALFVTFLWSTSWVLIKFGLRDIPALTFAGLRYMVAFLCLLPFVLTRERLHALRALPRSAWLRLILLGLLFYAATQGAQFLGLFYLPAITVSLLLNFTTIVVTWLGIFLLHEVPAPRQWGGVAINLAGVLLYFYPLAFSGAQTVGLLIVLAGVLANALSAILGRHVNRQGRLDPLSVTVLSMGVGAPVLLGAGVAAQGLPQLSAANWAVIAWLAVVNTAFAFTMWNRTLQVLSAMQSSIINSTMLVQIALLAWTFLGEQPGLRQLVGLALAGGGALLVQLRSCGQPRA